MAEKIYIKEPPEWEYIGERKTQSPIRTRREIVAGVYGAVEVVYDPEGGNLISIAENNWNAEELREAAHILNQIAEVLEENAG